MAKGVIRNNQGGGSPSALYVIDNSPTPGQPVPRISPPTPAVGTTIPFTSANPVNPGNFVEFNIIAAADGSALAEITSVLAAGQVINSNTSNLTVNAGDAALVTSGASITGNVSVNGGTLIVTEASRAAGNLSLTNAGFVLCEANSTVSGTNFSVGGTGDSTLIIMGCRVNGRLATSGIGTLILNGNQHSAHVSSVNDGTVAIQQNTISGDLTVTGAASCSTMNNTVSGTVNTPACP
jgi:type V secretory pathway adhesin AidA